MTVEKVQEMLLKDEQRFKADSGALTLVIRCHSHQGKRMGNCWHCGKTRLKEDAS